MYADAGTGFDIGAGLVSALLYLVADEPIVNISMSTMGAAEALRLTLLLLLVIKVSHLLLVVVVVVVIRLLAMAAVLWVLMVERLSSIIQLPYLLEDV